MLLLLLRNLVGGAAGRCVLHKLTSMLAFNQYEDALAFFGNQASYNFLSNILSRVIEQFLKLQAREAMDDFIFTLDSDRVLSIELIQSSLFLEHVFD